MPSPTDLFHAARDALAHSHSPYSKFPVGAAILADDGHVYTGANIENLSFPEGWCAETTALSLMVMGGARRVVEIAVYAPKHDHSAPCGGCRQRLSEFSAPEAKIHLCDASGVTRTVTLADLLPAAFDATLALSRGLSWKG